MAHELVYIYILFLRRSRSKHTPTSMTYGPFGNERAGESGRYWESIVFGGYIDMRHTTGPFPAEAIAIRDKLGRYAWRLSPVIQLQSRFIGAELFIFIGVELSLSERHPS